VIPAGVQVFVALEPVDPRLGFERLAGLAQQHTGYDARCGALFVFIGRRGTAAKVLSFDGTGLCLFHERLDRRVFRTPPAPAPGAAEAAGQGEALGHEVDAPAHQGAQGLERGGAGAQPSWLWLWLWPWPWPCRCRGRGRGDLARSLMCLAPSWHCALDGRTG
jgi:transposase